MLRGMFHLRHLRRFRRSGRVLAVCLAYALAIQAVIASVGTGMSAFAAPGQAGVICGQVSPPGPAGDRHGDRRGPNSVPPCPFCFVAAQVAGHVALTGAVPAAPVYAGLVIATLADPIGPGAFVPRFRRAAGDPRAPPVFSV
jgi:hypothetical protein